MAYIEHTTARSLTPNTTAGNFMVSYVENALIQEIIDAYGGNEGLRTLMELKAYYPDSQSNNGMRVPPFALGLFGSALYTDDGEQIGYFHDQSFVKNGENFIGVNVAVVPSGSQSYLAPLTSRTWTQNIYSVQNEYRICKIKVTASNDIGYGYLLMGCWTVNNVKYYGVNCILLSSNRVKAVYGHDFDAEKSKFDVEWPTADEDFSDTTSEPDGYDGKGAHDHTSDKISAASDPVVSTAQVGFFHIYHVSSGSLSALSQYLFPDILGSLVNADLEGILRAFASVFAYRDNIQYIVDLHAIPVAPTVGAGAYVKVGALETDISVPAVISDYVNFDCGSLSIPENFASFLDYTHTRAKLFLPGVGFVDIKNEFWQSGVLNVKYKFNVVDGSFMCFVSATSSKSQLEETVIGQYGGTMCIHFPVMSQSYGAMMSGIVAGAAMISTGGAAEAAAMQQGKTAAAAAAQQTKAQGYFSALQAAPLQKTVQSSNSYNSSTSFLGNRTPYLMIERAVPNYAGYYNLESGVPLNVSLPLAKIHGYTEIENIVFAGQTFATDEEIADIKEKLRNGVIF